MVIIFKINDSFTAFGGNHFQQSTVATLDVIFRFVCEKAVATAHSRLEQGLNGHWWGLTNCDGNLLTLTLRLLSHQD